MTWTYLATDQVKALRTVSKITKRAIRHRTNHAKALMNGSLYLAPERANTWTRIQILDNSNRRVWCLSNVGIIRGTLFGHFSRAVSRWLRRPDGGGARETANWRQSGIKRY